MGAFLSYRLALRSLVVVAVDMRSCHVHSAQLSDGRCRAKPPATRMDVGSVKETKKLRFVPLVYIRRYHSECSRSISFSR